MKKIFFLVLFLFLFSFSKVFAVNYFYDDFSSKNINEWDFNENGGNIDIVDNNLLLSSDSLHFPNVLSKNSNLFSFGNDFVLKIRFKYNSLGGMGDGISIGFTGTDGSFFEQFQLWRDSSHGAFLAYNDFNTAKYNFCSDLGITNAPTEIIYTPLSLDNNWHVLEIKKDSELKYSVYIDSEINLSPFFISRKNQCTPKHILLGNIYSGGGMDWNTLFVDYVSLYTNNPFIIRPKIIIIPGFGASWNSEAIVSGITVPNDQWIMTPFVGNYKGLIKALEDNNLDKNEDFYIWNYDWRKPVSELVKDLNKFINDNVGEGEKVVLVGHSMGGLISRIWAEENSNSTKLEKVISLGSPHLGSVDSYSAWNGGQVYDKSKFTSIALNILLQLQTLKTRTKMEAVQKYTKSVKDLLPTFDFVYKDGVLMNNNQLKSKNDYLIAKNNTASDLSDKLKLYVGNSSQTLSSLSLKDNTYFDRLLGIWPDGRIGKVFTDDGDGTVLVKSANYSKNNVVGIESNHGEIVDKTINKVMTEIGLSQVDIISETRDFKNSLVFFVGSPVKYSVKCDSSAEVNDDEGFVVIKNNNYKLCTLKLVGTGEGMIHVVSGNTENDNWSYWEKEIKKDEVFSLGINPKTGQLINTKENLDFLKSMIKNDLDSLLKTCNKDKNLNEAIKFFNKNQPRQLIKNIFGFRLNNNENVLTRKIINNAKIWMSITEKCSGGNLYNNCAEKLVSMGYAREMFRVSRLSDGEWWLLEDSDL